MRSAQVKHWADRYSAVTWVRVSMTLTAVILLGAVMASAGDQDTNPWDDYDVQQHAIPEVELLLEAIITGPGRQKITFRGTHIYRLRKPGHPYKDGPYDLHSFFPARTEIKLLGQWQYDDYWGVPDTKDNPLPGQFQDFTTATSPTSPLIFQYTTSGLKEMLYANHEHGARATRTFDPRLLFQLLDGRGHGEGWGLEIMGRFQFFGSQGGPAKDLSGFVEGTINQTPEGVHRILRMNHQDIVKTYKTSNDIGFTLGSTYRHIYRSVIDSDRQFPFHPVGRVSVGRDWWTPNYSDQPISIKLWNIRDTQPRLISSETLPRSFSGSYSADMQYASGRHKESAHVQVRYWLGLPQQVEAELTPNSGHEDSWLPEPGQHREYTLTLIAPSANEVEAVRFELIDVSSQPGIASNAGHHLLYPISCPDCENRQIETVTAQADFDGYPITRTYQHYNACPIDDLPDLFFRTSDNPGFDIETAIESSGLIQTIGRSIMTEDIQANSWSVRVAVADSAPTGRLLAEVRIGGRWYEAKATGDTASSDQRTLLLPNDADGNGIQDTWQKNFGALDPRADDDAQPVGSHPGDGLTNMEEYRGVMHHGSIVRGVPTAKDLFIHDYSGAYTSLIEWLRKKLLKHDIYVTPLYEEEMFREVVNYQNSEHHAGNQVALVMMDMNQNSMPLMIAMFGQRGWARDIHGKATHIGPPQKGKNTVILYAKQEPPPDDAATNQNAHQVWLQDEGSSLIHEVGHNINIQHHGNNDGFITRDSGKRSRVAVVGGQHSGDTSCYMVYRAATLFCDQTSATCAEEDLQTFKPRDATRSRFCNASTGTGQNTNNQWCGDATHGDCISQIKIKSY